MPLIERQVKINGKLLTIKTAHTVDDSRLKIICNGLEQLPFSFLEYCMTEGVQGELVSTDEAEVWKRVLNYRLARRLRFDKVLETHAGKGVGTELLRQAHSDSEITSLTHFQSQMPSDQKFDFIDIDPFGFPYEALELVLPLLKDDSVLAITSGESLAVTRNLPTKTIKTEHSGTQSWRYVEDDYIPFLEQLTGLSCRYFYAFPTSVRVIMTNRRLSTKIFADCPQYMWWFKTRKQEFEQRMI